MCDGNAGGLRLMIIARQKLALKRKEGNKMKMQVLSVAIIAGFVLVAGDASAQRGPDFGMLDINGDGSLTLEEVQGAAQARFDAADANGDGALSVEELATIAQSEATARAEQMLARFDENEDGALTIAEMRADRPERAARMFERVDADADGVITADEFADMRQGRGHGRDHD